MINHDHLNQNHPCHHLTYFISRLHSYVYLFTPQLFPHHPFLYCSSLILFNPHYYRNPMLLMRVLLFYLLVHFFEPIVYFFFKDILLPKLLNLCSDELLLAVTLSKNFQPRKIDHVLFQKTFYDVPLIQKQLVFLLGLSANSHQ